jgi:hypothetical protein
LSLIIDDIPTKISGIDVPKAITLKPIIKSLMPILPASEDALSINLFAPQIKSTSDTISHSMLVSNSISTFYIGKDNQTL